MGVRVGTDIVEVGRVARAVASARFTARVFTENERRYCEACGKVGRAASYAARWAAKESLLKALGLGIGIGELAEIEIINGESGAPRLVLHGAMRERAAALGVAEVSVSLSHAREYATAVVAATTGTD